MHCRESLGGLIVGESEDSIRKFVSLSLNSSPERFPVCWTHSRHLGITVLPRL